MGRKGVLGMSGLVSMSCMAAHCSKCAHLDDLNAENEFLVCVYIYTYK